MFRYCTIKPVFIAGIMIQITGTVYLIHGNICHVCEWVYETENVILRSQNVNSDDSSPKQDCGF